MEPKGAARFFSAFLALAAACSALAAEAPDEQKDKARRKEKKAIRLGEVVVTATRREIPVEEAPASVTVIERDEIQSSPAEKVDDILRNVPGMVVESHHGLDTPPRRSVSLRGVGPEQARTLILVDGIPINNMNNGWVEWSRIPKDDIERIEIVRGPASSLYGSNALGGVINIITRRPVKPSRTVLRFTYGSWDTWTTTVTQSGKLDDFTYYLSSEYYRTHGYVAEREPQDYNIRRFRREPNLMGRFTWAPDELTLLTLGLGSHLARRGHGREYFWLDYDSKDGYLRYHRDLEGYDLEGTVRPLLFGANLSLINLQVPPGLEAPPHSHPREGIVYCLRGSVELIAEDGESVPLTRDMAARVQPGRAVGLKNPGPEAAELLLVSSPPGARSAEELRARIQAAVGKDGQGAN